MVLENPCYLHPCEFPSSSYIYSLPSTAGSFVVSYISVVVEPAPKPLLTVYYDYKQTVLVYIACVQLVLVELWYYGTAACISN